MATTKKLAFPKNPGQALEIIAALRAQREGFEAQAAAVKSQEDAIREWLKAAMEQLGLPGVKGSTLGATLSEVTSPQVTDWAKLYAYIKKTGDFELLHRRVGATAWAERVAAGKSVPGVEAKTYIELKIGVQP